MSCANCERIQEQNRQGCNTAYIRIGAANVLIGACDYHFNMLRQQVGLPVELTAPVSRVIKEDTMSRLQTTIQLYDRDIARLQLLQAKLRQPGEARLTVSQLIRDLIKQAAANAGISESDIDGQLEANSNDQ